MLISVTLINIRQMKIATNIFSIKDVIVISHDDIMIYSIDNKIIEITKIFSNLFQL